MHWMTISGPLMAGMGPVSPIMAQVTQVTKGADATTSPALLRKASQRIMAQDGNLILEKYMCRSTVPEEEAGSEGI